jgi:hypothetical protein
VIGWLVKERGMNRLNVTIGYPEMVTVTRESGPAAGSAQASSPGKHTATIAVVRFGRSGLAPWDAQAGSL